MLRPSPLKRLRVDMKRLNPSEHEEAVSRKFEKKSVAEEAETTMVEVGAAEGSIKVFHELAGRKQKMKDNEHAIAMTSCFTGVADNNENLGKLMGDDENNVENGTPSCKAIDIENGATTVDNPRMLRRSRRVSGSQAIILRSRRFSGDSRTNKCSPVNQRPRRFSVGETKTPKLTIDSLSMGGIKAGRSLGDNVKTSENVIKLIGGSKTGKRPRGRPPKVARISEEEQNTLTSKQRRGLQLEEDGEDAQNNNALLVKVEDSQFSCQVCGKNFEFPKSLKMHEIKMHKIRNRETGLENGGGYQCGICGKEFSEASLLTKHSKDPKAHMRPFACSLSDCSRTFSQLDHLFNHNGKVHEDRRVIQCENCHLRFSSPKALAFHSNLKYCYPSRQRSFLSSQTPSTCLARFSNPDLLQLHLKLRHQDEPPDLHSFVSLQENPEEISFKCSVPGCFEYFLETRKLQEHEDCCRKRKLVTCRNCRDEFGTPLDMLLHRISCEQKGDGTKSNSLPFCPNCSRKFKGDRFLQNHMKSSSCKESFKTFICDAPKCGKIFEKPVLLRNHLYSHTDAPFHCCRSSCGLSFVQLVNYRNHCKQKHNGDLNLLKCDLCDDVFTVESHLECHRESIHKDVSYDLSIFEDMLQEELTCPFCEEKFEAVSVMRVHLVGEHPPPWTCKGCGDELLSLKQTRYHFLNCKLKLSISNIEMDSDEGKDTLSSNYNAKQETDATDSKDCNSLQLLHSDATQEESLDAQQQNSLRSQDDSMEGLSETLNETTLSSEHILQEVTKSVVVKEDSLEIIAQQVEGICEAKKMEKAVQEKLVTDEGLEDTGDVEDDAIAVTDYVLTKARSSFSRDDEEEIENDAVEVTDNIPELGEKENREEPNRSKEDALKEREVVDVAFAKNFKTEMFGGIVVPNQSFATRNDAGINDDLAERQEGNVEEQNLIELEEAVGRQREAAQRSKEAERLHLEVVRQPGCPVTGNFAKAFGISANFIQLNVIPELLEPCEGCYPVSLTNGLAIDLLEVASTRGISMERLVNFLRQFVIPMVGGMENDSSSLMEAASQEVNISDKDVAAVVVKLSKVKVQAARFRARYSQLPHYLDDYLTKYFNPFF